MNHKFPAIPIPESEPLDKRLSKRLFFYEYFIYMESACVAPWPMPPLNTGTHSGAGGQGQVCVQVPRGPSHSWSLEFHLPRGPQQLPDAWAGVLSVLNERESSPGFSLLSSGLGMGSLDGYLGR